MFAIVELKGKQHSIRENLIFLSELTGEEPGSELEIDTVLMASDGTNTKIGTPYIPNAKVKVLVLENSKGPKIRGFKYKRKTGYSKRWGHRQSLQKLKVLDIMF